jgi:hypothetical protein
MTEKERKELAMMMERNAALEIANSFMERAVQLTKELDTLRNN